MLATRLFPWRGSRRILPGLLLAAALYATPLLAEVTVPALSARITDLTNTLDARQRASLEQKLAAFEATKGSQIAVLLVPTTQPETIEQYSIRVADQWKLGRKGVGDGVLVGLGVATTPAVTWSASGMTAWRPSRLVTPTL